MLNGEGRSPSRCADCGLRLVPQVLRSAAGYYIGTFCNCGPHSRESGYYKTKEAAQKDLDNNLYFRL